jgi:tetratricopeptide (TPR) repeat protein
MVGKRLRLGGALAALVICLSCGGGSSVAYREGRKAEARKDWDSALVNYEKALQADPANAAYVLREQRARTQASLFHLKNGRQLLKEERLEEAAGELQKAVNIDPSNQAAAQEPGSWPSRRRQSGPARPPSSKPSSPARRPNPPGFSFGPVQVRHLPIFGSTRIAARYSRH